MQFFSQFHNEVLEILPRGEKDSPLQSLIDEYVSKNYRNE